MAAIDKLFGMLLSLLALGAAGTFVYAVFFANFAVLAIQLVVTAGFLTTMGILFWMGWTITITPTIEEIRRKK